VAGEASGPPLHSALALSFWGGVDPMTGVVIDRHHPLAGLGIAGKILVFPGSRGSSTGSGVLLELLLNGVAPAGMIVERGEEVLTLGAIIAEELFGRRLPIVEVDPAIMPKVAAAPTLWIKGDVVADNSLALSREPQQRAATPRLRLSDRDRGLLDGAAGQAAQKAMRIVLRMAEIVGAEELIDVTRAHIDGCIYTGAGGLAFAEHFRDLGGRVAVPTTLNAVSVDCRHWRDQGVATDFGEPAQRLAEAYVALGASPTFTCAPYLRDSVPTLGEQIAWAESNAIAYANSVLGARTMKYPDYLDLCIALTGRAPAAGCHLVAGRRPTLRIEVAPPRDIDDAFWPLLGYLVGQKSPSDIPLLVGLEDSRPTQDDLKAFSAAFATTSGAPMFHIAAITPEAGLYEKTRDPRSLALTPADLRAAWRELNSAETEAIDLVAIGSPHVSGRELRALAELCRGKNKNAETDLVITGGRSILDDPENAEALGVLQGFGARIISDTCWCMLGRPIIPDRVRTIMTNSAKYAHYGPGLVGRPMRFGSLAACVEAARTGRAGLRPAHD